MTNKVLTVKSFEVIPNQEVHVQQDGKNELELYIGGWYITNVKIKDLSPEAMYEIGYTDTK